MKHEKIIIIDFGGQYAHLIASRIRRQQVLAEIHQPDEVSFETLSDTAVKGIILSGGPQSVYDADSPKVDTRIFELDKPILGICYGHQFMNASMNGKVTPATAFSREYGRAELTHEHNCPLFKDIPKTSVFWMSHGDEVSKLGDGFIGVGNTKDCKNGAVWNADKNFFGIQFHPEVTHSEYGNQLLKNFLDICEVSGDWTIEQFLAEHSKELAEKIGNKNVFLFVSGGVDSSVCFAFLTKILGAERVKGLFVDNGLLRADEKEFVQQSLTAIGADLTTLEEAETFLGNLKGLSEPEAKRNVIGNTFLDVQKKFFAANKLDEDWILAQGTIYPDTIESGGTKNSSTIKTHHNRVPEIQKLIDEGKVIEPVADLYKDEVRELGTLLGLPKELVWRHPFPGPGLGVRTLCSNEQIEAELPNKKFKEHEYTVLPNKSVGVQGDFRTYRHPAVLMTNETNISTLEKIATEIINHDENVNRVILPLGTQTGFETATVNQCDINHERLDILKRADKIVTETLLQQNLYQSVWQFPTVLVPVSFQTGQESIVLRPINSIDAMSASVGKLPWSFFESVTEKILEDERISKVFLDITSKPPGTIEWE
ncbi:glutamine-hydrolyzing GMP synthase [bacterium DOLZORAL124_38_8]|nr:MAG: glutamine-hydrolyzing GMP synthase [bacterium DOLZORAL124_38_8]